MFSRVINKIFRKESQEKAASKPKKPAVEKAADTKASATAKPSTPPAEPSPAKEPTVPKSVTNNASSASVKEAWVKASSQSINSKGKPEELCEITPDMSKEAVLERLAMLYRRHNRAASSLDPKMRDEAEIMLEAISGLREKYGKN